MSVMLQQQVRDNGTRAPSTTHLLSLVNHGLPEQLPGHILDLAVGALQYLLFFMEKGGRCSPSTTHLLSLVNHGLPEQLPGQVLDVAVGTFQ